MQWILFAAVLAFALKPLQVQFFQRKLRFNKTFSVYLLLSCITIVFIPFFLSLISFFSKAKSYLGVVVKKDEFNSVDSSLDFLFNKLTFMSSFISKAQAKDLFNEAMSKIGEPALGITSKLVSSLPSIALGLFFFAACMFYFISDSKNIYKFTTKLDLIDNNFLNSLVKIIQEACQASLFAGLVTGLVQALILAVVAYFLGLKIFFVLFFITFFISQVPLIGIAPVSFSLILYFYLQANIYITAMMISAVVLASISDNIVRAWMLNRHQSLHPLAGLISAIGGILVLGPVGVFIGPVSALIFIKLLSEKHELLS